MAVHWKMAVNQPDGTAKDEIVITDDLYDDPAVVLERTKGDNYLGFQQDQGAVVVHMDEANQALLKRELERQKD